MGLTGSDCPSCAFGGLRPIRDFFRFLCFVGAPVPRPQPNPRLLFALRPLLVHPLLIELLLTSLAHPFDNLLLTVRLTVQLTIASPCIVPVFFVKQ